MKSLYGNIQSNIESKNGFWRARDLFSFATKNKIRSKLREVDLEKFDPDDVAIFDGRYVAGIRSDADRVVYLPKGKVAA